MKVEPTPDQRAERSRLGKLSRRKGIKFELWLAKKLKEVWPNARRGFQARDGNEQPDVLTDDRFWVEAKHGKKVNYRAALRQAKAAARVGSYPVVVAKDDGESPVVVMDFDDWLDYVKEGEELRET